MVDEAKETELLWQNKTYEHRNSENVTAQISPAQIQIKENSNTVTLLPMKLLANDTCWESKSQLSNGVPLCIWTTLQEGPISMTNKHIHGKHRMEPQISFFFFFFWCFGYSILYFFYLFVSLYFPFCFSFSNVGNIWIFLFVLFCFICFERESKNMKFVG